MIRCAVVGASGYTGAELITLLLTHPEADLVGLFGSERSGSSRRACSDLHPRFRGVCDDTIKPADPEAIAACRPDSVFLCTPHEVSADIAAAIETAAPDAVMLDLSAAFRLPDPADYERYYGFAHPAPAMLDTAVYGLAELNKPGIERASLIAVPGCYPTSVILPLAPLVRAGAIAPGSTPIADCISGISGAGRTPSERNMFAEVSVQPYGVWTHRHTPEIGVHCGAPVIFTPHIGPYDRGIVSTMHVQLGEGWNERRARETLHEIYADSRFVRVLPESAWPSVNGVRHTNFCDIGLRAQEDHLILVSAIDNLLKGASGQAVQCMNIRHGIDEAAGLPLAASHPGAPTPTAYGATT